MSYNFIASISSNLIGIMILVSLLFTSHLFRDLSKRINRLLLLMCIISLFGCISDLIYVLVNGRLFPGAILINHMMKIFNNLECIYAGVFFIFMVIEKMQGNHLKNKGIQIALGIFIGVCTLIIITNPFTHIVFTVDENNIYRRAALGQIGFFVSMICLLYTVILLFIQNQRKSYYLKFPLVLYFFPFLVGGGIQMFHPYYRLSNLAFAIAVIVVHMDMQRTLYYTDPLTGVYNRVFLDHFFNKAKGNKRMCDYGGFMIDVNSFKEINDTLGHDIGDEALQDVAKILGEAVNSDFYIMRYGGDEFILLCTGLKKEELKDYKQAINETVEAFNTYGGKPYTLSFAIGTAMYYPMQGGSDIFFEQLDRLMYEDKKAYYDRTGKERRMV